MVEFLRFLIGIVYSDAKAFKDPANGSFSTANISGDGCL